MTGKGKKYRKDASAGTVERNVHNNREKKKKKNNEKDQTVTSRHKQANEATNKPTTTTKKRSAKAHQLRARWYPCEDKGEEDDDEAPAMPTVAIDEDGEKCVRVELE